MDRLDGVVKGHRPLRRNQVGDLHVVTAALGPDQGRHTEHAAAHRLLVLASQRREIGGFEVVRPTGDVQPGALRRDLVGRMLIDGQVVLVLGALQLETEAVSHLGALSAGRGRGQERRQPLRSRVALPDRRLGMPLVGRVVLAEREEPKLGPDPTGLFDLGQPHGSPVGPGAEEVDVDGRLADGHLVVECTGVAAASRGITSVSKRCSGSWS